MVSIHIEPDILLATTEALRDLKTYYEADAAALARLNTDEARSLAQERLEQAAVVTGLYDFFGAQ